MGARVKRPRCVIKTLSRKQVTEWAIEHLNEVLHDLDTHPRVWVEAKYSNWVVRLARYADGRSKTNPAEAAKFDAVLAKAGIIVKASSTTSDKPEKPADQPKQSNMFLDAMSIFNDQKQYISLLEEDNARLSKENRELKGRLTTQTDNAAKLASMKTELEEKLAGRG